MNYYLIAVHALNEALGLNTCCSDNIISYFGVCQMKVALNQKRKKLHGFSFSINIAKFEAFLLVFKLTKNLLLLKVFNDKFD